MANEQYPHLKFERFYTSDNFRNPRTPRSNFDKLDRDRSSHGDFVKEEFKQAVSNYRDKAKEEDDDLYDEDIIYLEFESVPGFHFKADQFDDGLDRFKLSYSKTEYRLIDGEEKEVQKIGIYINKKGISAFLKKIEKYLNPEEDTSKGRPSNEPLLANIASIRAATLECFWTERTEPFPESDEEIWWEVWLRRDRPEQEEMVDEPIKQKLINAGISIGERRIIFPEHIVLLTKGSVDQLSRSLLYTDKLAELRKPRETAEFFLREEIEDPEAWIENIQGRIDDQTIEDSVLVCLLDSGVNRGHPLLQNFLPPENMHTVKPDWDNADAEHKGHGTQMAGNALFGNLTPHITGSDQIQLFHKLESVKIYNPNDPHDKELYGAITIDAASQPVVTNPDNNRVYCMSVTAPSYDHQGESSSWSSALDSIVFSSVGEPNDKSIFLVSAGNVVPSSAGEYPSLNEDSLINDPAQALNALTIGAFTELDSINPARHPNSMPLAKKGGLSPYSTTGIGTEKQWANKPDVVFEGGNMGIGQQGLIEPDTLKLLSVGHDPQKHLFSDNYATSAATALASNFAAQLYSEYPEYWPETIRGLIVHSADWTDEMKHTNSFQNVESKLKLLRSFGYGSPDINKARYSASDRLTLIGERTIQPYIMESDSNRAKINEFHLFELPWPKEALQSLFDEPLRVNITLSYFIEPNPGKKVYSQRYSYQSVGLRFKMSRPNERKEEFASRINKLARDDNYESSGKSENWVLGPETRDRGSIHRDWCNTTGPELAEKNFIAVFPIGGWWKTRKGLGRFNEQVRYSLIVSIESPEVDLDVDLYTPVENLISVDIEV